MPLIIPLRRLIIFISFILLNAKIFGQPLILRMNYPVSFNKSYTGIINGGIGLRIPFNGGTSIGIYSDYTQYNSKLYKKINNFNVTLEANTVIPSPLIGCVMRPYVNIGYAKNTNFSLVDEGLKMDGGLIFDHFKKIKYSALGIHICYRQFIFKNDNYGFGKYPGNLLIGVALRLF